MCEVTKLIDESQQTQSFAVCQATHSFCRSHSTVNSYPTPESNASTGSIRYTERKLLVLFSQWWSTSTCITLLGRSTLFYTLQKILLSSTQHCTWGWLDARHQARDEDEQVQKMQQKTYSTAQDTSEKESQVSTLYSRPEIKSWKLNFSSQYWKINWEKFENLNS